MGIFFLTDYHSPNIRARIMKNGFTCLRAKTQGSWTLHHIIKNIKGADPLEYNWFTMGSRGIQIYILKCQLLKEYLCVCVWGRRSYTDSQPSW